MGKWSIFSARHVKGDEKRKEIRYILSIDGGGMRGVVPAYILSRINKELKKETDRPLYSFFDLVAGTSTGALIALALTSPSQDCLLSYEDGPEYEIFDEITYKRLFRVHHDKVLKGSIKRSIDPDSLVSLYRANGYRIFYQPSHFKKLIGNVFSDKYDSSSIERFLSSAYKETGLDQALVPTMAVAFDPLTSKPYVFSSWDSHGFLLKEAARASSAAPTYFSPVSLIDRETGENLTLVDGGLCANNPILLAYSKARELYPNADEFRALSISTCSLSSSFDPSSSSGGLATWVSSLWKSYASGTTELADIVADSIKDLKYLRIWDNVVKKKYSMDDYSDEAMNTLLEAAEELYKNKEAQINEFIHDMTLNVNDDSVKLKGPEAHLLIDK